MLKTLIIRKNLEVYGNTIQMVQSVFDFSANENNNNNFVVVVVEKKL